MPKTLQLTIGETGTIGATVNPPGLPVAWSSLDENVATVDGGIVTAIGAGTASIVASIEYDGRVFSDTATVDVSEPEPGNVVFDLTDAGNWADETLWAKQDYQQTDRQTYIAYGDGWLNLVFNPDGNSTTLYADVAPNVGGFAYDDSYTYHLELTFENDSDTVVNVTAASGSNRVFAADGWDVFELPANTSATEILPLMLNHGDANRLIVLQARKNVTDANGYPRVRARIVREPV